MIRIAEYQADQALNVLPQARANGDNAVINACIRVREGWLLGQRVDRADLATVAAFAS